jgi:hypothetical protein
MLSEVQNYTTSSHWMINKVEEICKEVVVA